MKTLCIVLVVVFFNLNHASQSNMLDQKSTKLPSFIINGQDAKLGEIPHQLAISKINSTMKDSFCGAVLISSTQALTAAHCVHNKVLAREIKVFAGVVDRLKTANAQVAYVKKIVVHPKFRLNLKPGGYDLAILTFKSPLNLNKNVQPIAWNKDNRFTFAGEKCVLSGWGRTNFKPSHMLKKVTIDVLSHVNCRVLRSILTSNICAFTPTYGACFGDSGGPMTCHINGRPVLAGVTSYVTANKVTHKCNTNKPSVYSRVSSFKIFIEKNLEN